MAVHLFGAIDVGSYVYEMKIFELSKKNGIRQIDNIRHMVDIGTDTYHTGKVSRAHLAELNLVAANDEVDDGIFAGLEGDVLSVGIDVGLATDGERDGAEACLRNHDAAETAGIALGSILGSEGDSELAAVIGHEVGHAIAKHGQERASQQMLTNLGSQILGAATAGKSQQVQQAVAVAYGMGTQYGALLPFSRKHELEADYIGIVLATIAGYDANASIRLWQKMQAASTTSTPEFASTHPSSDKRISELQKNIPVVKATYGKK